MYQKSNINEAYQIFETKVEQCIENQAPMKVIQPKKGNKNWLTPKTRETDNSER